jgi:hypothetical protein
MSQPRGGPMMTVRCSEASAAPHHGAARETYFAWGCFPKSNSMSLPPPFTTHLLASVSHPWMRTAHCALWSRTNRAQINRPSRARTRTARPLRHRRLISEDNLEGGTRARQIGRQTTPDQPAESSTNADWSLRLPPSRNASTSRFGSRSPQWAMCWNHWHANTNAILSKVPGSNP